MFKVNNRNTRTCYDICSNLTIKTPERRQWSRSGVFIVNFEHVNVDWERNLLCAATNSFLEIQLRVKSPELNVKFILYKL